MTRALRRLGAIAGTIACLAVLAGCTVPKPPGAAPLRYRDPVFSTVTVTRDLQYGSAPDAGGNPLALRLDLYAPSGDTRKGRPAVVWIHGGGFSGGDKRSGPSADLASTFAKLGYVAVSINYRLLATTGCNGSGGVTQTCYDAAIAAQHDAQAAIRWLRAHAMAYGIDATRIGIGGESAGAVTASLVGVHSEDPGDSGNPGYPSSVGGWVSISGGLPGGIFVNAGDAPGVLFHGTADPIVPYQWSVDTSNALLSAGIPAFLEPLQGAGHVPYGQYHDLIVNQSDYFFYTFLDLAHAPGQPAAAARSFDRRAARLRDRYPRLARGLVPLRSSSSRRAR